MRSWFWDGEGEKGDQRNGGAKPNILRGDTLSTKKLIN